MKADKVSLGVALKRLFACLALSVSGAPASAGQAAWESDIQAKAAAYNLGRPLPETPRPRQVSSPHGSGWWQAFERGRVYWLSYTGARAVQGDIGALWAKLDREQGELGFPLSDEGPGGDLDPRDRIQRFTGGAIYWQATTRETVVISNEKADVLTAHVRAIQAKVASFNLGEPLPETPVPALISVRNVQVWWQAFERGRVYWTQERGALAVFGDIGDRWAELNREQGPLGLPLTDEVPCQVDPRDRIQVFDSSGIYWRAATRETTVTRRGGFNPFDPSSFPILPPCFRLPAPGP